MKLLLPGAPPASPEAPLSDLEARLQGPDAMAAQRETLDSIAALEERLRGKLSQGVSPADYPALVAVLDACQAAREVLTMAVRAP
jgi:hypothetical protein